MGMAATVKHRTPGRLRLKVLDEDFSPEELKKVVDHFRVGGEALSVEANLLTKTLLIKAADDKRLQEILDKADKEGLFAITEAEGTKSAAIGLLELREAVDRFFRDISDGRLDFRSGMAAVMVGLGLRQAFVGKFLPAGLTLVFYALGLLEIKKIEKNR